MTEPIRRIRAHPVPLEKVLERARQSVLPPPVSISAGNGTMRDTTTAEKKQLAADTLERTTRYARWRVQAYETGVCAHPY